jgi:hypothetical protein
MPGCISGIAAEYPDPARVGVVAGGEGTLTTPLLSLAKRRVGQALGWSATVSEAKQTDLTN